MKINNPSQPPLALVTGVSSGIGWAAALKLASSGYSVIGGSRRIAKHRELEAACLTKKTSPQQFFRFAELNVACSESTDAFFRSHSEELNRVQVLINNAGLALGLDPFDESPWDNIETMVQINIIGLLRLTHKTLPLLKLNPLGHIVNIGSVAGKWSYKGAAVYCATKFAVRGFSEALRCDLLGSGVRISNIEPGMVATEFSEVRFGDAQKAAAVYQGLTPLHADDIADTILWCLNRPPHVNIQEIVVYPTDQASPYQVHRQN